MITFIRRSILSNSKDFFEMAIADIILFHFFSLF